MPPRALETPTESMFYVLLSLSKGPRCGTDIAGDIHTRTHGRVRLGPATLYTILGKFEKEGYIEEIEVSGRKRTYRLTQQGLMAYRTELERLRKCVLDAEAADREGGTR